MAKRFCILMGSPRLNGNTAALCKPLIRTLREQGGDVRYRALAQCHIAPCRGCYACQDVADAYGCAQRDDMDALVEDIRWCDCLILATPIYSWYCTAEMKAFLDRCFGLSKFYRSARGSLWAGKRVAILATHGYEADYAAAPFETGIRRLCDHAKLHYAGMYSVRDIDDLASFQTESAVRGACTFALSLLEAEANTIR